ncbi:glycosyl transferase [Clostridium zeae]|uniref:Glycosyl transferase n=1 Tax=Clostridium zeae TaxID=2759022 RepID=A0ABQ1E7V9_9CLOT|nr:glycosyltransferase [Clostridium zeae]GFZ30875.1 glycosyl transferase [Clostridium zeae]
MKLSVIIPTYNNLQRLKISLSYLEQQDMDKSEYDIILVDDGSNDGTSEYLGSLETEMNLLVVRQENMGQAKARNVALSLAEGEYVLFIDDDVIADRDFLTKHYESHMNYNDPNLVVVGQIKNIPFANYEAAIELINSKDYLKCNELDTFVKQDPYLNIRNWVWDYSLEYVSWLAFTTANASMSRDLVRNVGGFDEGFVGWGPEDVEMGYRLKDAGAVFEFKENIKNYHLDKAKSQDTFYSGLKRNLRYLTETKYPGNEEIGKYILFIGGQISIEEFNAFCSKGALIYNQNGSEHHFEFINYFLNKVKERELVAI